MVQSKQKRRSNIDAFSHERRGLWLTPRCVDSGLGCRKLSDRFNAHETRQVQDSAMRPPAAGTPSVMGIDERVLGGLLGRARFDSSSRFSLPPSVIIRLTFPGRTRSTLLYFCAVQPSLQSQHWLAFYVGLFLFSYFSHPRPPSNPLCIRPILCLSLSSLVTPSTITSRPSDTSARIPSVYHNNNGFTHLSPSYGHELSPGLDGSKVVFAKR